jgi:hypothetical protein
MNAETATPGIYRLKANVTNPEGDLRVKHDWKKVKMWKKGQRFLLGIDHQKIKVGEGEAQIEVPYLLLEGEKFDMASRRLTKFDTAFHVIVMHLEPADETLDTVLTGVGLSSRDVLGGLIDAGKLNLSDIKEIIGKIG